jgi:hypothetical protein
MIITTSMPALVLALVTTGAIPDNQAQPEPFFYAANGVTAEAIPTDRPLLDGDTRLAVGPAPGYLESEEWQRWQQQYNASKSERAGTNA